MITFKKFFLCLACLAGCTTLLTFAPVKTTEKKEATDYHIIFDLNGVLVRRANETKVLGLEKFIKLALLKCFTLQNPLTIKKSLRKSFFNFLHSIETDYHDNEIAYDEEGSPLPQIMNDWMKGRYSPKKLLAKVDQAEARHKKGLEISIAASIARMIFDPHTFIQTVEWVPETVQFVQELKDDGCKVYILSNWDPYSFELMQEQYPDILNLFDGIMISGDIKMLKPDSCIYEKLIETFNINSSQALFFDDQEANVLAAIDAGIDSKICLQKKSLFNGSTPNINDLKNHYHQWRYHRDNTAVIA